MDRIGNMEKHEEVKFRVMDVANGMRNFKMASWKTPGSDGVRRFFLRGLRHYMG